MADIEGRLREIEARLLTIERALKLRSPSPPSQAPTAPTRLAPQQDLVSPLSSSTATMPTATTVLGWGGMAALTLAAGYLIRLAITAGWLTPVRQVALAALLGIALILVGFSLIARNPRYASLLPGCGVVVLFLADYGAHLYHGLINPLQATVGVVIICVLALALGRIFEGEFYALFAVIGSYSGPIMLSNLREDPTDLAIYFSAWSILYCWYAINIARRQVYLLAAYLAFIVFDFVWRTGNASDWVATVIFQFIQLLIFTSGTVMYSVVNRAPLEFSYAKAHIPVLLLFYFVQYTTLRQHMPAWAPWIAFGSLGLLLVAYGIAHVYLKASLAAGRLIIAIYAAVVLLHAGYFELLPDHLRPWLGLGLIVALAVYASSHYEQAVKWWPLFAMAAIIFLLNYGRLLFGWEVSEVPGYKFLIPLYAVALYVGYWLVRQQPDLANYQMGLLYMGHVNTMAGAGQLFEGRLVISLVWGILAVATLLIAIRLRNKSLGRSALFVFGAFAAKVWLFDLSGIDPLVRIGCLLVLGVSLYVGGLLYQKVDELPKPAV